MDGVPSDIQAKYQKLAAEYSKLRAQAAVLRRAVLDEQNRSSGFREILRTKESALRKADQEVDSLTFRNEQLLRRVSTLQDDLENYAKTKKGKQRNREQSAPFTDSIVDEELQKKIIEIAQISSQISDRVAEVQFLTERVESLENRLSKQLSESTETETRLRKEITSLRSRIIELEGVSGGSEGGSLMGSEDGLSVIGMDDHNNINNKVYTGNTSLKEHDQTSKGFQTRLLELEKEVQHWKAKYKLLKLDKPNQSEPAVKYEQSTDSNMLGSLVMPLSLDKEVQRREESHTKYFTDILGVLSAEKIRALAHAESLEAEVSALQNRLHISENDVKSSDVLVKEVQTKCTELEEELATTRLNYELQLRMMTEHIADLHDKLHK